MESEQDTMITLPILGHFTYREWHALANGFFVGVTAYKDKDHEYTKEKHYWRGGFLLGQILKLGLLLWLGPELLAL